MVKFFVSDRLKTHPLHMFYTIQSHNLQMLRKYANYIGLHLRDFPGDYPRSAPVTFFIGPFSFPHASPFALG